MGCSRSFIHQMSTQHLPGAGPLPCLWGSPVNGTDKTPALVGQEGPHWGWGEAGRLTPRSKAGKYRRPRKKWGRDQRCREKDDFRGSEHRWGNCRPQAWAHPEQFPSLGGPHFLFHQPDLMPASWGHSHVGLRQSSSPPPYNTQKSLPTLSVSPLSFVPWTHRERESGTGSSMNLCSLSCHYR